MIIYIIAIVVLSALWSSSMLEKRELAENLRDAYKALNECNDIMRMQRENIESSDKFIAQLEEYVEILEEAEKYD